MVEKKSKNPLIELLAYAGDRRWLSYVGCVLSMVSQLLGFAPFICIWLAARDLIAVAPDWSAATGIAVYGWAALAFSLASIALYFAALMCTHLAAFRCASNLRKAALERLTRVPLGYFDVHASGALRRVIDGSTSSTEQLLAHMLPDTAGSIAMVAGTVLILFVCDWRLGLACMAPIVVSVLCMARMMSGKGMKFMTAYQEALVRMTKAGTEYVRGIPVVKVFQQTVYSFKAFHDAIVDYSKMAMDYAVSWCQLPQVVNLTALNGLVIFLVPAAILIAPGEGDLASFVTDFAFYAVFSALIPTAMTKVMFMSQAFQTAADAYGRIEGVLKAPMLERAEAPVEPADNSVEFCEVRFTYEGAERPALDSVSFTVAEGATVALVGPSGGGKSTAASLVPRFWDASSGCVKIGGVDVRRIDPRILMKRVAFVFQTNRLFNDSLLENVRAARPDASREEVARALEAAQCSGIVEKLPQGLDTPLGSGGFYLSGGEVQRVALARAILKDAPIVVLDEATAFADPENEALIQKALARLMEGRTVLMIAHRLSTVVGADSIVVIDRGKVVETGTHAHLRDNKGLYARMWADYERSMEWRIGACGGGQSCGGHENAVGSAAVACGASKGGEA